MFFEERGFFCFNYRNISSIEIIWVSLHSFLGDHSLTYQQIVNYFTPSEATDAFRITAINKSKRTLPEFAVMAILGGAFIAFGGLLTVIVAGGMPGVAETNPGIVKFVAGHFSRWD